MKSNALSGSLAWPAHGLRIFVMVVVETDKHPLLRGHLLSPMDVRPPVTRSSTSASARAFSPSGCQIIFTGLRFSSADSSPELVPGKKA
jgi:hypothetical protein